LCQNGTNYQKKINTPHHIYLVYDFEEDNTLPAALAYQKEGVTLRFLKNRGKGVVNAIITGLRYARGEYLLVSMADSGVRECLQFEVL